VATGDYVLMFRRKGENPVPVAHEVGMMRYAGERTPPSDVVSYRGMSGDQKMNKFSQWIWRQYASCMWDDIRIDRVLPYRDAKDGEDEKHVHPLQLDVIERCVTMWSNPGENVLTPFMGVGSEVYGAVLNGRRGIGIELKPSYYRQAIKNLESIGEVDTAEESMFASVSDDDEES
jgi:DNA modification methylase